MKLYHRVSGEGEKTLLILHGLFGTGGNWQSVARVLSAGRRVILPDLRNHGRSPHSPDTGYGSMAADCAELLSETGTAEADVLGHSMGGKAAMLLALTHPALVRRLIVADIAPKPYPPVHLGILDALLSLDMDALSGRKEADEALRSRIPDAATRAFLLTNLVREEGSFRFRMNLSGLSAGYDAIAGWSERPYAPFDKPVLFIRGSESDYINDSDMDGILNLFPKARLETIPGASHWVHAEKPDELILAVERFLAA